MLSSSDIDILTKIVIAAVIGLSIGLDRQINNKPAGTRTQMLICVGSALLSAISIHIAELYKVPGVAGNPDPARLMAQIITGIGFLGAGVILKENNRISGVTTAATIWITASLGIAVGAGFYAAAAITMFLVLLLHPLGKIQYKYGLKSIRYFIQVPRGNWEVLLKILDKHKAKYSISKTTQTQALFIVYSSQRRKNTIAYALNEQKIDFVMFEEDE